MLRTLVTIFTISCCSAAYALESGQSVIVIRRAQLSAEQTVVAVVPVGTELVVESEETDRIQVSNGKSGWLNRNAVMSPTDALEHFSALVRSQPRNAENYFARGNVYRSLGRFDEAVADFNTAIRLHPQAAGYNGRGRTFYESGDVDRAIDDFTTAIQLSPRTALLYNNRAAAWEKKGDLSRANADLERAQQLDPNHDFVRHNQSRLRKNRLAVNN